MSIHGVVGRVAGGMSLVLLLAGLRGFGADTGTSTITWRMSNMSGNDKQFNHACNTDAITYVAVFGGATVSGAFPGCCGTSGTFNSPVGTSQIAGEATYFGLLQLLIPAEICCSPGLSILSGVPNCFDVEIDAQCNDGNRPSFLEYAAYFRRNSSSFPMTTWVIKDASGKVEAAEPENGAYQLTADGMSQAIATLSTPYAYAGFQFTGDPLGCTLNGKVLTAGTNEGRVQVTAVLTNSQVCAQQDFYFNLQKKCLACEQDCTKSITVGDSVSIRISLGASRHGAGVTFLHAKAGVPTPALGTPELLRCDYIRPDLEKITNAAGWLRQVRAFERIIDIVTNSAVSYSLKIYSPTNLLPKTNGLYQFLGAPWNTITIELVGGDTNQVRVTDSAESTVSDFVWQTNGWELVTGGGLRHELKTVSVSGGTRTEVRTIKNGSGVLVRQSSETWQTNTFGDRLTQEVFGAGADARTNSYTYDANGFLRQVTRGDGSWDIYVLDGMNRQIEHYSPFLNSAPTTNSALCRLTTSTYTNSVVSGSGDDFTLDPYRPRLEIDYVQGVEVSRRYAVVKSGERRDIRCPNPGAAWNDGPIW